MHCPLNYSYLFPVCVYNKLIQNLVVHDNHLLSHSFCGSDIWVWPSWSLWLEVSQEAAVCLTALMWEECFQAHSCGWWPNALPPGLLDGPPILTGCSLEAALIPCHGSHSVRWWHPSEQGSERVMESLLGASCSFCKVMSRVISQHLFSTRGTKSRPPPGEGITQVHEY